MRLQTLFPLPAPLAHAPTVYFLASLIPRKDFSVTIFLVEAVKLVIFSLPGCFGGVLDKASFIQVFYALFSHLGGFSLQFVVVLNSLIVHMSSISRHLPTSADILIWPTVLVARICVGCAILRALPAKVCKYKNHPQTNETTEKTTPPTHTSQLQ